MNRITCILMLFLLTEIAQARSIYFYDSGNNSGKGELNITASSERNYQRKIYMFNDSKVVRKTTYKIPAESAIKTASLSFQSGYRRGDLFWNKGFLNKADGPNILSELEWNQIDIAQLEFSGAVSLWNRLRFGADFGFGFITDGTGRDSDYLSNNKQGEFSRSRFTVDGHDVIDVSVDAGYDFEHALDSERFFLLSPLVGYSYHAQNLQFEDGIQVIPSTGGFDGLDSEYKTNWYGPWVGVEVQYFQGPWSLAARYSHHWADYEAEARWNLRADFQQPKSFEHISEGEGDRISLSIARHWKSDWDGIVSFGLENWEVGSGTERIFFSNGAVSNTTGLNVAEWDSWWITAGLKHYF